MLYRIADYLGVDASALQHISSGSSTDCYDLDFEHVVLASCRNYELKYVLYERWGLAAPLPEFTVQNIDGVPYRVKVVKRMLCLENDEENRYLRDYKRLREACPVDDFNIPVSGEDIFNEALNCNLPEHYLRMYEAYRDFDRVFWDFGRVNCFGYGNRVYPLDCWYTRTNELGA